MQRLSFMMNSYRSHIATPSGKHLATVGGILPIDHVLRLQFFIAHHSVQKNLGLPVKVKM